MTDTLTLDALGFTREELAERIINTAADRLLVSYECDEDGEEYPAESRLAVQLQTLIKKRIDEQVTALADKHVLPHIAEFVETYSLQATNQWGEARGTKVSFTEYLIQRAEAYMTEQVNYDGKPKGTDSYNWAGRSTRVAYMIDKHLHYSIETAIKKALAELNSNVAKGLADATKLSIGEALEKLKVQVSTK
jgi:uncharacterized membrane protein YheB (UPF0754 family)